MSWAILYTYMTPLLASFDLDINVVGLIWFIGSFATVIICPLVGASSDYTQHPWGRRRVYIIGFLFVAISGLLLLAYAEKIGWLLGDSPEEQFGALTLAIIGLLVCDMFFPPLLGLPISFI